jgi:hypothetical protein
MSWTKDFHYGKGSDIKVMQRVRHRAYLVTSVRDGVLINIMHTDGYGVVLKHNIFIRPWSGDSVRRIQWVLYLMACAEKVDVEPYPVPGAVAYFAHMEPKKG